MFNVPITTPPSQWQANWLAANPGKTAADAAQVWNTPNFGIAAGPNGPMGSVEGYDPNAPATEGVGGGGARAAIAAMPQSTTQADRMTQIQANQQALQQPASAVPMQNPMQQQLNALNRVQQYFPPPTNYLSSNNPQGALYQPTSKFGGAPQQQTMGGGKMMNQPNGQWYGYSQPPQYGKGGGKGGGGYNPPPWQGSSGYSQPYYGSTGGGK